GVDPGNSAIGVQGLAAGQTGVGVHGENTNAAGATIGVLGITRSTTGTAGVFRNRSGSGRIVSFQINASPLEVAYVQSDGSVHAATFVGDGASLTNVAALTATKLAANGSNCAGVGEFAKGVDDSGNAEGCAVPAGGGTVTSVGLTAAADFSVTGSPVTGSGTLDLAWVTAPTDANTASAIVKRDGSGNFSAGTITTATGVLVNGSVGKGTGIRHIRLAGCSAAGTGSTCSAPILPYDFTDNGYADYADTNYTIVCSGEGATGRPTMWVNSKSATDFQMTVNSELNTSGFSTIDCILMHD
ncbi:MAG: hypothetical protein HYX26_05440, partial [Acidobacteriales bacterium]|nr:hypothetical protein [Terriglobales bacterium]